MMFVWRPPGFRLSDDFADSTPTTSSLLPLSGISPRHLAILRSGMGAVVDFIHAGLFSVVKKRGAISGKMAKADKSR